LTKFNFAAKVDDMAQPLQVMMKNGDIRKLPKSSSPMWHEQWAAQGTAKVPYIVSRKKINMGHDIEDSWACSCPDWTRHTPRAECKHIIRVQKKEGMLKRVGVAKFPPGAQGEAFKRFLMQEEQKKIIAAAEGLPVVMHGDKTSRKFR
jgi:hypothetical protein